jgi:hypothetical protein
LEINNKSSRRLRKKKGAQEEVKVIDNSKKSEKQMSDESIDNDEDTLEEDIGDFSICHERMAMQNQIKSLLGNNKEKLVMVETEANIDEESDDMDMDTNENPFNEFAPDNELFT